MYELIKVGERTYYVSCPTNIGIYKISDTDVCLINSGNDNEISKNILKILSKNGWSLKVIINTHSNTQGVNTDNFLRIRTGCKIYTPNEKSAYSSFTKLKPAFLYGGRGYKEIRKKHSFDAFGLTEEFSENVIPNGIELVQLDGLTFNMVAVKTSDGVWFLSDSLISENTMADNSFLCAVDLRKRLCCIEKIKTLKGVLFIPSYSDVTDNIIPLAEESCSKISETVGRVKALCVTPITLDEIIKKILSCCDTENGKHLQNCTMEMIRPYILYLSNEGEIDSEIVNDKLYWKVV